MLHRWERYYKFPIKKEKKEKERNILSGAAVAQ